MNFTISRPHKADELEICDLFSFIIKDTFKQDGIDKSHVDEIEIEIKNQVETLKKDFASSGSEEYFLIAKEGTKILGTIAFGQPNELIKNSLKIDIENIPEIKSVYVHPDYQSMGIGSFLFKEILIRLYKKNIIEYCLDCGYKKAQLFWINKLGEPAVVIKNYYGINLHHMIWSCKIKEMNT